ncbi:hypothetical protein HH299_13860, partial [Xanthomonas sp. Kuri4-2]
MSRVRFGLQARFLLVMALAFVLLTAIVALLLQRQAVVQREVRTLSGELLHDLFDRSLRARGESLASELAGALVNPLYYSDLGAVGGLVRGAAQQSLVSYVRVFDAEGRLVHDGSADIPHYGQRMADPLAARAVAADHLLTQASSQVLEVAAPVRIGT